MGCQVISWEFEKVTDYEADSDMVTEMEAACSVLHQMRFTQLSEVESEFRPLSSVGSRGKCRVLSLVVAAVLSGVQMMALVKACLKTPSAQPSSWWSDLRFGQVDSIRIRAVFDFQNSMATENRILTFDRICGSWTPLKSELWQLDKRVELLSE